ncbi:transcription factor EAT1-like protein [Cinnamomum micranthum f. kanehirae]|uniref:Transcription factor EAT1-like protein n=1 Tax=Cinnamomum micranthum f. kanehirae TaxID=337451 RepID=A0A3S3MPA2_9MAGN|nr:transcription factor EAT1-like protein [Cinnamomum micranthum f. kanehirae]
MECIVQLPQEDNGKMEKRKSMRERGDKDPQFKEAKIASPKIRREQEIKTMDGGCDYFDPQDVNPIQGRIDGQPQTAINCPEVAAMGGSSSNNLEDNLRLNFFLEDLSKTNPPSEVGMGIDLQQQLRFDLEQEYNSHLMQDMLQDSHSQLEHRNWEQDMQEMDIHQQQQIEQQQQMPLPHDLQCFNSAAYLNPPYTTPDLLNLLHLPRCSVTSMLPASSIAFNSPESKHNNFNTLDMFSELPMTDSTSASTILYDPPLQLSFPPQPPIFRDLFHSLPLHDYSLPGSRGGPYLGGVDDRDGNGGVFQEGDGRQFDDSLLDFRRELPRSGKGEAKGFATEKQRREQLGDKFKALASLVPTPTKTDRASVVSDAIDYIKELHRRINELKILVEKKRCARERRKRLKVEDDASNEIESSSVTADRDQPFNGSLRSSWLLRKSKETMVDVRIIEDEVNIKLTQRKKANFILLVAKILDELQLELLQLAGGNIGDYYIFMFNAKIGEDSSVYASAIANKMIEVLDRQHLNISC